MSRPISRVARDVSLVVLFIGGGAFGAAGYLFEATWFVPACVCSALLFVVARGPRRRRGEAR